MPRIQQRLWFDLAVGLLGLVVGGSNLYRWLGEAAQTRDLVIGAVCTVLAIAWLISIWLRKESRP